MSELSAIARCCAKSASAARRLRRRFRAEARDKTRLAAAECDLLSARLFLAEREGEAAAAAVLSAAEAELRAVEAAVVAHGER